LFDSSQRLDEFIFFMRNREKPYDEIQSTFDDGILKPLVDVAERLSDKYSFTTVLPLPSRTWAQREVVAEKLADELDASVYSDALYWKEKPEYRQGELLNNDQRRDNVKEQLTAKNGFRPSGDVLLLDDYTGSNATLREGARVLRKEIDIPGSVVPLTIASVKWKLGSRGIV